MHFYKLVSMINFTVHVQLDCLYDTFVIIVFPGKPFNGS